jgi:hypothetical protein
LGTNATGDYIKDLVKKQDKRLKKNKKIEEDPEAKKKEWLNFARAFGK